VNLKRNVFIERKRVSEVYDLISAVRVKEAALDKNLDDLCLLCNEYWHKAAGASG
jgi:hypothetical protein